MRHLMDVLLAVALVLPGGNAVRGFHIGGTAGNPDLVRVSLDRTHDAWVQGIADLQFPWRQISDMRYRKYAAAALYGVNSILHTLLIDPNDVIVDKNLRGKVLDNRLTEFLGQ